MRVRLGGRRGGISVGPLGLLILGPFIAGFGLLLAVGWIIIKVAPYVIVAVLWVVNEFRKMRADSKAAKAARLAEPTPAEPFPVAAD